MRPGARLEYTHGWELNQYMMMVVYSVVLWITYEAIGKKRKGWMEGEEEGGRARDGRKGERGKEGGMDRTREEWREEREGLHIYDEHSTELL